MRQTHGDHVLGKWNRLLAILEKRQRIDLQGDSLNIPDLVAVARYKAVAHADKLSEDVVARIDGSVQFLHDALAQGHSIYGTFFYDIRSSQQG